MYMTGFGFRIQNNEWIPEYMSKPQQIVDELKLLQHHVMTLNAAMGDVMAM